ncbi:MAG: glycosyltransferase, partial [Chloroflexota bacterium]|nr:glycosyltransferase [Chloroflexota bacterium]
PLKVLEYLAMGKPVVATPLREILAWPGVATAGEPEDFAAKIDAALAAPDAVADDEGVREFVAAAAWEKTTQPLIERLR